MVSWCERIASQSIDLNLLQRKTTKETLQILASETMLCFECGDSLQQRDGELVCRGCGVVWGNGVLEDDHIPFETKDGGSFEAHWSPPNELSFNRAMGTNQFLTKGSFCRIVAPVSKEDVGLRARHLRALTLRTEHPWIVSLLEEGSKICKRHDLHRKDNACIQFSNWYGKVLRALGAYIVIRGKHWTELKKTARAAFVLLYAQFAGEAKAEEARQQLGVDRKFLRYVAFLVDKLTPKHRNARKR